MAARARREPVEYGLPGYEQLVGDAVREARVRARAGLLALERVEEADLREKGEMSESGRNKLSSGTKLG